ncbi:hypothetical protein HPP92_008216 [Vanilla planifolia]|uniref:Uncharacterized protein n=1 Tax=Vanilla planifolia TaxID=51239 RepID=A0A835RBI4_VANPL|nr:hypothetical protein HPP92_008216 [Vanilla planifolia]
MIQLHVLQFSINSMAVQVLARFRPRQETSLHWIRRMQGMYRFGDECGFHANRVREITNKCALWRSTVIKEEEEKSRAQARMLHELARLLTRMPNGVYS